MNSNSIDNRVKIIEIYYENGRPVKTIFRRILDIFGRNNRPSETAIKNLVDKFRSTGLVHNIPTPTRAPSNRSAENTAAVSEGVEEDPNLSVSRRSQ